MTKSQKYLTKRLKGIPEQKAELTSLWPLETSMAEFEKVMYHVQKRRRCCHANLGSLIKLNCQIK